MNRLSELTNRLGIWGSLGLGLIIGILLTVLAYLYVISPYQNEIEIKRTDAEQSEKTVAQLKVLANNRDLILTRGAEIYAEYLKGSKLLPNGEQISQVLEAIEGKAGENGTQVLSFDAFKLGGKSTVAPQLSERVIEGELRGSHAAMVGFLRSISYYERITEVRAVSAVKDDKGMERLKFNLAAYYLPAKIEVPAEVRQRALEILNKEGFDFEQTERVASISSEVKIR